MIKLALVLAASTVFAAPAMAAPSSMNGKSNSYGNGQAKVCLVTFESGDAAGSLRSDLATRAKYLPLPAALKMMSKDMSDTQQILTYGPNGYDGPEVTAGGSRLDASDLVIANSLTSTSTTQEACAAISDYASSRDMSDEE
jgi:hypothetical protein